jgi:tetratricopeptide (TPR) repeat protein
MPQDPDDRLIQGVEALRAQDFGKAHRIFARLVKSDDGGSPDALLGLATAQLGLGELEDCESTAKDLIELGPTADTLSQAYLLMGVARMRGALKDYAASVRSASGSGEEEVSKPGLQSAEEALRHAATPADVSRRPAFLNLAYSLYWRGRLAEAELELREFELSGGNILDPLAFEVNACLDAVRDPNGGVGNFDQAGEITPASRVPQEPARQPTPDLFGPEGTIAVDGVISTAGQLVCRRVIDGPSDPESVERLHVLMDQWRFVPAKRADGASIAAPYAVRVRAEHR